MKRTLHPLWTPFALLFAAMGFAATAHAAPVKTVTINLNGQKFGDNVEASADSGTVDNLLASPRYDYQITAKVTGSGSFALLAPAGTDLGDFLDLVKPGTKARLKGTVLNRSGKLPLTVVFNETISGNVVIPVVGTVSASLVLTAQIDAAGKAGFKVTKVSLKRNGLPVPGDLTFDATSNVKIGNELLGTEGVYAGLTVGNTVPGTLGLVSVKVDKTGAFSGQATIGGRKLPFKGAFKNNTSGEITLIKPAAAKLTLTIIPGAAPRITGTIAGAPDGVFTATKAAYSKTAVFSKPGTYNTLHLASALPVGKTAAEIPQGTGFGVATIAGDGSVRLIHVLGDGTRVSAAGVLTSGNQISVYASLYKGQGVLVGLLRADPSATTPAIVIEQGSALRWLKSPIAGDKRFAGGFDTSLVVASELYTKPAPGIALLPASLPLKIAFGNLGTTIPTQQITIDVKSKATAGASNPNNVKVTLKPATGLFTGSFTAGNPVKTYKFSGLILPKTFLGAGGFFVGQPTGTPTPALETGSVALK